MNYKQTHTWAWAHTLKHMEIEGLDLDINALNEKATFAFDGFQSIKFWIINSVFGFCSTK